MRLRLARALSVLFAIALAVVAMRVSSWPGRGDGSGVLRPDAPPVASNRAPSVELGRMAHDDDVAMAPSSAPRVGFAAAATLDAIDTVHVVLAHAEISVRARGPPLG